MDAATCSTCGYCAVADWSPILPYRTLIVIRAQTYPSAEINFLLLHLCQWPVTTRQALPPAGTGTCAHQKQGGWHAEQEELISMMCCSSALLTQLQNAALHPRQRKAWGLVCTPASAAVCLAGQ
eukprot:398150-Pelagomonas_calceolata.AAC.4